MLRVFRFAVVALLAGAVAAPSRAAEVDSFLPKETEFVAHANVKMLLGSDIVKKYALAQMKQALEGQDAQKILKDLGLDPMKDVDTVTVGAWGKDKDDMNAVAVIRGTFDSKKIMEAARNAAKDMADKISIVKEGDLELIKFTGDQGKPGYIAVLEGKPIFAASDKKLVATAAAVDAKAKPALSKELSALVAKQDTKASLFVCAITDGKIGELPGNLDQIKELGIDVAKIKEGLGKMRELAIALLVDKDVSLAINMGMKDKDSAADFGKELGKLVNTGKALLPLAGAGQPMFKSIIEDVVKYLDSAAKDNDVVITVKVSAEAIGKASGGGDDKDK